MEDIHIDFEMLKCGIMDSINEKHFIVTGLENAPIHEREKYVDLYSYFYGLRDFAYAIEIASKTKG